MKQIETFNHDFQSYCIMHRLMVCEIEKTKYYNIYFAYPIMNDGDYSAYIIVGLLDELDGIVTHVFLCDETCIFKYNKDLKLNNVVNYQQIVNNNIQAIRQFISQEQ